MELNLGIRAHDLAAKTTPEELAMRLSQEGFHYAQLVYNKAFAEYSYDEDYVRNVQKLLTKKGIKVVMLGAYFNPVHSDPEVVKKGLSNFIDNLRIAHLMGHPYVGSETGSYSDNPWVYVPKNRTPEAYEATKKVFMELTRYAEEVGEDILIEPAWGHVIYSPRVLRKLLSELHSERVHVTIDLYNLLYEGNFARRDKIFLEALRMFGSEVKVIHLKDAKIIQGQLTQLAPGEGDFHYPLMIEAVKEYCPNATLVFEGVKSEKIVAAHRFIQNLL